MLKTLAAFLFFCSLERGSSAGQVPVFSKQYSVKGTLHLPYAEIQEPFTAWYDASNDRSRIDYYGGMAKTLQLGKKTTYGALLKITPVTTEKETNVETCFQVNGSSKEERVSAQSILPDLTGFKYVGTANLNSKNCELWSLSVVDNYKVNNYTAYVIRKNIKNKGKVPVPVRYEMKGYNSLLGSHFDHYYLNYNSFSIAKPHASVFQVKLTCNPFPDQEAGHYAYTFNPIREFLHNNLQHIDHAWDKFHEEHQKSSEYESEKEHLLRKNVFHQNFRYIESKNRENLGYKLGINHLADRTPDELRVLRGRKHSGTVDTGASPFPYSEEYLKNKAKQLPSYIDWRINGAVTPVKDQAVCGSCWSFGTTGTVEGAFFLKHGYQVRLSQQALVDCSWGFGNNGCNGGEDFTSYQWIMKHGGIPTESDYGPYLGENGYCHIKNLNLTAAIKSYVKVKKADATALKTALVNHGPISVAIDASHRSFSFYSSGVYYEPKCGSGEDSLDHAVLLVGYGTLHGKPYWLVKNSWSTYWGNDGYILFSQKNNNCGVMTAPTYVNLR